MEFTEGWPMAGKLTKLFGVGLYLAFLGTNPVLAGEAQKETKAPCATCKVNKHGDFNWRSWLFHQEATQGRNNSGARNQGTRQLPLYLFFAPPCQEKPKQENCAKNYSWSPTGWRNFTSTGHRMFDLPTQFGVGSGQD